jgi:predicted rRNA methylase YqxC with S4 and FtsJ domains
LVRAGMIESPITGDTGNREFFLHLRFESGAGGPRD